MVTFAENTGAARIYNTDYHPSDLTNRDYQSETVKVDLMDNVIPRNVSIDFMLIDVEKMELEALLGMRRIIERSRSVVMMVEWQYGVNEVRNETKTFRCINWLK
jgi:FkbM family methyltransferase